MACPPVRGDNPRALASGLSYGQVDKHDKCIYILYTTNKNHFTNSRFKLQYQIASVKDRGFMPWGV